MLMTNGIRAANAIEEVILREGADTVGGPHLEPVTAGGGVIEPPKAIGTRVQEICKKYDILLIIDEVVCGMAALVPGSATSITAWNQTW